MTKHQHPLFSLPGCHQAGAQQQQQGRQGGSAAGDHKIGLRGELFLCMCL